jgi:Zn-dependent protease
MPGVRPDIDFASGLIWYVVFLYSTVCHEAGHAWSAHRLGDSTAYEGGQVSLDPLPHIRREPIGMVVVPLLSFFLGGWMLGWASAPYDPGWAERHPRRAGWMALAGPAANLALLLIAALLIRIGMAWGVFAPPGSLDPSCITAGTGGRVFDFFATVLSVVFSLNLLLFSFNLLPLPPFDGGSIPLLFLGARSAHKYLEIMWNPTIRLFGLIIAWRAFGHIFPTIELGAVNLLYPGVRYY